MELTLKNYKRVLSADLIRKAEKNTVRECDEVHNGHFQAYVDEKENSFDTHLKVDKKGKVTDSGCDCQGALPFCRHKTALLLFVSKGKKVVSKLKMSKKVDSIEKLLEETDPEKLKRWLLTLFSENKDLEISFLHQFSLKEVAYKPEEIKRMTHDAVKAVVKNRRKLEISEVKKIVALWTSLHESMVADYCTQMNDEDSFLRIHAIMDSCDEVWEKVNTTSSRITGYQENVLNKILDALSQVMEDEYWSQSVQYFIDRIISDNTHFRRYYQVFLQKLHEMSALNRKKELVLMLISQYLGIKSDRFYGGEDYTAAILYMVINSGLFDVYYLLFKPIHYKNDYNKVLITELIRHGFLPLAEKYCLEQMEGNHQEDYNVPYYELLVQIYTLEKQDEKLATVLKVVLSRKFDFNAYLFVERFQKEGKENIKWRNNLFASARRAAQAGDDQGMLFSFHLLAHEQKFAKMIDYLDVNASYEVVTQYAEQMILADRSLFLNKLIKREDGFYETMEETESEMLIFQQLLGIILKHYAVTELKGIIKSARISYAYYSSNKFVRFIEKCR